MPNRIAMAAALAAAFLSVSPARAAIDVVEASIADLQKAMTSGKTTSRELTQAYLTRIKSIDKGGPRINAMIALNPEALAIAAALDKERKEKGPRGPLHGIPVVLKDIIATGDKMPNTAGSLALKDVRATRDAFVVQKLREAGAVILGKANLSEWGNIRSTRSTSGWSALGGLTRNPYALDRNTGGSSSGTGAAVAASLAAVGVGGETDGSIISPSHANGLVGIKPTVGLVSRSGIIPISTTQDTAGPMARTVADAAIVLTAIAGTDPRDATTLDASVRATDYTKALDRNALKGARIGVVRSQFGGRNDLVAAQVEKAIAVMREKGAILVDVPELPNAGKYGATEYDVMMYELKAAMPAYLSEYAPHAPVKTLADIIAFNEREAKRELKYFGQEHFLKAESKGGLDSAEYQAALASNRKLSREEGIDKALRENNLDALVAPSGSPAWLTDFVRGDFSGGGFSQAPAVAGYPHITVPAGFVQGLPCGISFVGTAWSEAKLIGLAYAFEQATKHRRAPKYRKSVNDWNE